MFSSANKNGESLYRARIDACKLLGRIIIIASLLVNTTAKYRVRNFKNMFSSHGYGNCHVIVVTRFTLGCVAVLNPSKTDT